jgi:hypothetical protein
MNNFFQILSVNQSTFTDEKLQQIGVAIFNLSNSVYSLYLASNKYYLPYLIVMTCITIYFVLLIIEKIKNLRKK